MSEINYIVMQDSDVVVIDSGSREFITMGDSAIIGPQNDAIKDAILVSTTMTLSWLNTKTYRVNLTIPTTTINFTNAIDGQLVIVDIKQDATGGRTISWDIDIIYDYNIPSIDLNLSPNAHTVLGFLFQESTEKYHLVSMSSPATHWAFISQDTDPDISDIQDGFCAIYKNSISGLVKLWVNDGDTMKSVLLS